MAGSSSSASATASGSRPGLRTRVKPGASRKATRLKLTVKSSGKGNRAGQSKTLPYMQGFEDRELDSSDDETGEGMAFEEQLILRLPAGDATEKLKERVRKRDVGVDGSEEVSMKFKDSRRALFKVGDTMYSSRLVDLPTMIESHKTLDNRRLFKVADISQMLLATHIIKDESEVTEDAGRDRQQSTDPSVAGDFDVDEFIYPHGITPPMHWARKRRFRKRAKKKQTTETVEQEVARLLADDGKADVTEYDLVDAAEVEMEDGDGEGAGGGASASGRSKMGGSDRDDGSIAGTPYPDGADGETDMASQIDDGEEVDMSQMGDGSVAGGDDDDDELDLDLQAELEAALGEDDEESVLGSERSASVFSARRSRAPSDDEDLWDDNADTRDVDADVDDEDEDEDVDDEEDLDDEVGREERVREAQLESECREIDALVKKNQAQADATQNPLIKRRQLEALKKLIHERDLKKNQLAGLKEERRRRREDNEQQAEREKDQRLAAAVAERRKESERERDNLAAAAAEVEEEEDDQGEGRSSSLSKGKAPARPVSVENAAARDGLASAAPLDSSREDRDVELSPQETEGAGGEEDAEGEEDDADGEADGLWA